MVDYALTEPVDCQRGGETLSTPYRLPGEDRACNAHRVFSDHWVDRAAPLSEEAFGTARGIGVVALEQDCSERPGAGASKHFTHGSLARSVGLFKTDVAEIAKSSAGSRHVYEARSHGINPAYTEPVNVADSLGGKGVQNQNQRKHHCGKHCTCTIHVNRPSRLSAPNPFSPWAWQTGLDGFRPCTPYGCHRDRGSGSGSPPGSTYVPAHTENGRFVPGETK